MKNSFDSIESAIEDLKNGKMIIVVDDEDRENEGDFIMSAEMITSDAVNFMAKHGRGIICTPITIERADELDLQLMVKKNDSLHETAFTVSVDSIDSGTGISAEARKDTILKILSKETKPEELVRPGHIFPLIAKSGGVLQRAGHTEAAIDLAKLAGHEPVGVICEIMDEDGTMARRDRLFELATEWNMKLITIKDLIEYRRNSETVKSGEYFEPLVKKTSVIDFPNKYGNFKLHMFKSKVHFGEHHIALVMGEINENESTLVRVHSECLTGDIFGSRRCECGAQLEKSMELIAKEGGVLIYLRQEGRGIGLPAKIKAYEYQDQGFDTVEANHKLGFKDDLREYGVGAQMLKDLGVKKMNLLTNNPRKIVGLKGFDLEIVDRTPIEIEPNEINKQYLKTKKEKLGHILKKI